MTLLHAWRPSTTEISTAPYSNIRQQDAAGTGSETYLSTGGRFGEAVVADDTESTSSSMSFDLNGGQRDWDGANGIFILTSVYIEGSAATGGDIQNIITIGDRDSGINPDNNLFMLHIWPSGNWHVRGDGTSRFGPDAGITSEQSALRFFAWNSIEIKVTEHASAGTLTMKINGITVINNLDIGDTTSTDGPADVTFWGGEINTGAAGTKGIRYGDTLILDGNGSEFNDFIGDFRFEVDAGPTGDGTTTAWTSAGAGAAYVEIDDTEGTPDDDTTYIESTTAAQDSFVTYAGATLTNVNNIYGVLLGSYARDDAGSAPLQIAHRVDSSSTFATGTTYALTTSYELVWDGFEQDPNTSTDWTKTTIDAAEWGVQSIT